MRIQFYDDKEANQVAERFFKYDYHDRGIKKWGGFFLSEHTAELKKFEKKERLGDGLRVPTRLTSRIH